MGVVAVTPSRAPGKPLPSGGAIPAMVEVDGDDGGGQILRTSLTLAMLTGKAMTVEGGRPGSEEVRFDPGEPSTRRWNWRRPAVPT